jgi:hypothetical protein
MDAAKNALEKNLHLGTAADVSGVKDGAKLNHVRFVIITFYEQSLIPVLLRRKTADELGAAGLTVR